MVRLCLNFVLIVFGFVTLSAQGNDTIVGADSLKDTTVAVDTTLYRPGHALDEYLPVTDTINLEKRLSANPTVALFKSMLIPGWGQLDNGSPVRAIIYAGLDAWFIGAAIHYKKQAADFRDLFNQSTEIEQRNDYYALFNDRRDERNKYTWFAVIVTFVAMFDAYVDAHLSGFPEAESHPVEVSLVPDNEGKIQLMTKLNLSF